MQLHLSIYLRIFMQSTADNYVMYTLKIVNELVMVFLLAGFTVLFARQLCTANMQRKINTAKHFILFCISVQNTNYDYFSDSDDDSNTYGIKQLLQQTSHTSVLSYIISQI